MRAAFSRHKLAPSALQELWADRHIAIHYLDIPSIDPNDYQGEGKNALKRLLRYCESGVIVGATYRSIKPAEMLIGRIRKNSKIIIKNHGKSIYKTVQLHDVLEVSYRDYPLLSAIQPIGRTLTGWPSAQKYLEAILDRKPLPWEVGSLHPSQLEVLCYEYLKLNSIVDALLLPIGRTLRDVDIYGINKNGTLIVAQVTHSNSISEITEKIKMLSEYYSKGVRLIYFGLEDFNDIESFVEYIPIELVFEFFSGAEKDTIQYRLINKMLRWDKVK